MTTLNKIENITTTCFEHVPHVESISTTGFYYDTQYTFCEVCENNIDRFYIDPETDRLGHWSKWSITK